MGVKMSVARDVLGKEVTLDGAQFSPRAHYRCKNCDAEVVYNAGSNPERNGRSVTIPHYFKLKRKISHENSCPFNVLAQVRIIASESSPEFIGQFKEGIYELRLLLPETNPASRGNEDIKIDRENSKPKELGATKKYVSAGKLNSYLNTANRVLKLRAFCEEHSEIENHLILKFETSKIFWKDFFFEIDDYKRLYRVLGQITDSHPVAVSGKIDRIKKLESQYKKGAFYWLISLDQPFEKPNAAGVVIKTAMTITVYDERLLAGLKENDDVVLFGKWNKKEKTRQPNKNTESKVRFWENLPLSFHLTHQRQITILK